MLSSFVRRPLFSTLAALTVVGASGALYLGTAAGTGFYSEQTSLAQLDPQQSAAARAQVTADESDLAGEKALEERGAARELKARLDAQAAAAAAAEAQAAAAAEAQAAAAAAAEAQAAAAAAAEAQAAAAAAAEAQAAAAAAAEAQAAAAAAAAAQEAEAAQEAQRVAQEDDARQAAAERANRDSQRDPRSLGRAMAAAKGWGADQFSCLDSLWTKESGWKQDADNPTSSAYGIPQSLPGSKMATHGGDWRTNPATQISWGLEYIASSYGTPCAAWDHSQANNWY